MLWSFCLILRFQKRNGRVCCHRYDARVRRSFIVRQKSCVWKRNSPMFLLWLQLQLQVLVGRYCRVTERGAVLLCCSPLSHFQSALGLLAFKWWSVMVWPDLARFSQSVNANTDQTVYLHLFINGIHLFSTFPVICCQSLHSVYGGCASDPQTETENLIQRFLPPPLTLCCQDDWLQDAPHPSTLKWDPFCGWHTHMLLTKKVFFNSPGDKLESNKKSGWRRWNEI